MPRGMHPNSLANLKKGKATQFGKTGEAAARASAAGVKSHQERRNIAAEMKALLDDPQNDGASRRKALAAKLVSNMEKSPEWYKLGLRMLGELPPEQVEVSRPTVEIASEIEEALMERENERKTT